MRTVFPLSDVIIQAVCPRYFHGIIRTPNPFDQKNSFDLPPTGGI